MQQKGWTERFANVTRRVAAQLAFVFIGEAAERARQIKWPVSHVHYERPRVRGDRQLDATTKIYLFGVPDPSGLMASFRISELTAQADRLGIQEAYVEWTFMRRNARAACARASENAVWGFGRPHPRKPNFKPHPDLAGPLVDYRPGTKDGWRFEPVIMKVLPSLGDAEHVMELVPEWGMDAVAMVARDPKAVPPQLEAYQFSGTVASTVAAITQPGDPPDVIEKIAEHMVKKGMGF